MSANPSGTHVINIDAGTPVQTNDPINNDRDMDAPPLPNPNLESVDTDHNGNLVFPPPTPSSSDNNDAGNEFGTNVAVDQVIKKEPPPILDFKEDAIIQRQVFGFLLCLDQFAGLSILAIDLFSGRLWLSAAVDRHLTFAEKATLEYLGVPAPVQLSRCNFDLDSSRNWSVNETPVDTWPYLPPGNSSSQGNGKKYCVLEGLPAEKWLFWILSNWSFLISMILSAIFYCSRSLRKNELLRKTWLYCFVGQLFVSSQKFIGFLLNSLHTWSVLLSIMHQAVANSNPPFNTDPILDMTQALGQCCGVEDPSSWEVHGTNQFPHSCCNYMAFNCSSLQVITRKHVWTTGCYQREAVAIFTNLGFPVFVFLLKLVFDYMNWWALHDVWKLTRRQDEECEAKCRLSGHFITCWTAMNIKGVTREGQLVAETNYFMGQPNISETAGVGKFEIWVKTKGKDKKIGKLEVEKLPRMGRYRREDVQVDVYQRKLLCLTKITIILTFNNL